MDALLEWAEANVGEIIEAQGRYDAVAPRAGRGRPAR
jgi:hypothetical protein